MTAMSVIYSAASGAFMFCSASFVFFSSASQLLHPLPSTLTLFSALLSAALDSSTRTSALPLHAHAGAACSVFFPNSFISFTCAAAAASFLISFPGNIAHIGDRMHRALHLTAVAVVNAGKRIHNKRYWCFGDVIDAVRAEGRARPALNA